jgi:hypothetical protein
MNAWFSPDASTWFSYLSMLSLLATTAPLAQRGVHKATVVGAHAASIGVGVLLLALGAIAVLAQQPGYVIFPLLFTGVVVTAVVGSVTPVTLRAYRDAEARKIVAKDL